MCEVHGLRQERANVVINITTAEVRQIVPGQSRVVVAKY